MLGVRRTAFGGSPGVFPGGIRGAPGATNAAAGQVGEYIQSVVSAVNFPTSTQLGDAASISLTAGDWDVSAIGVATANSATVVVWAFGISVTTGNSATGLTNGSNYASVLLPPAAAGDANASIPNYRLSLAATTTVYLKFSATYSVATPLIAARLSARRQQPG